MSCLSVAGQMKPLATKHVKGMLMGLGKLSAQHHASFNSSNAAHCTEHVQWHIQNQLPSMVLYLHTLPIQTECSSHTRCHQLVARHASCKTPACTEYFACWLFSTFDAKQTEAHKHTWQEDQHGSQRLPGDPFLVLPPVGPLAGHVHE